MIEVLPTLQHSKCLIVALTPHTAGVSTGVVTFPGCQTSFSSRSLNNLPSLSTYTHSWVSVSSGTVSLCQLNSTSSGLCFIFSLLECVYTAAGVRMPYASTLFGASGNKIQAVDTQADGKTYEQLRQECLQRNKLFEDPDFPAQGSSLFYSQSVPVNFEWKRPGVCTEPQRRQQQSECNTKSCVYFISCQEQEVFQLKVYKWICSGFE